MTEGGTSHTISVLFTLACIGNGLSFQQALQKGNLDPDKGVFTVLVFRAGVCLFGSSRAGKTATRSHPLPHCQHFVGFLHCFQSRDNVRQAIIVLLNLRVYSMYVNLVSQLPQSPGLGQHRLAKKNKAFFPTTTCIFCRPLERKTMMAASNVIPEPLCIYFVFPRASVAAVHHPIFPSLVA
jgi:hypothetical protein